MPDLQGPYVLQQLVYFPQELQRYALYLALQACMGKLQLLLKQLDALGTEPAPAQAGEVPDAAELRQQLTGGVQHCLFWLFGLELPGLDKQEEWGGDFHVSSRQGGEGGRCLVMCSKLDCLNVVVPQFFCMELMRAMCIEIE